jgi:hypothetical protein
MKEENFPQVATIMLECLKIKENEAVAIQACEFWCALSTTGEYDDNPRLRETQLRICLP